MDQDQKSQMLSFMVPGTNYGYQGAKIDTLASFENTLAIGLLDESGSTTPFARQMEVCVKEIIKALRHSPKAANLIYAHYHFDTHFREVHGFKPLIECDEADYDGIWAGGGRTTLYDSEDKVINFLLDYALRQRQQHYTCNGIVYIITDGQDFGSTLTQNNVKLSLAKAIANEDLESLVTILIGINDDPSVQADLRDHATRVGFTAYQSVEKADEQTLAQLAGFVSKSVAAQSKALGTNGPSQVLTF